MSTAPDINFRSIADQGFLTISNELIDAGPDSSQYSDILKISHCNSVNIVGCTINRTGGNLEDGVDIMRQCQFVSVINCLVGAGRKYAFTIKGGSAFTLLEDVTILRHGSNWERVDIDIGNYSATTPDIKTGTTIIRRVRAADGRPVRLRVGWAQPVVIEDSNVELLRCQSLGLKAYVQAMRLIDA